MPGFLSPFIPCSLGIETPLLLASNFVWKTFLKKCCWVQKKKDTLGSRIFLWTKEMGLTYCGLQVEPSLFFKSRCTESLRKADQNEVTVAHCVQGGWGRAGKKGRKRRAARKNTDSRAEVKPEAHPQSLVEQGLYWLFSSYILVLTLKTSKYHNTTYREHIPSF